MPAEPNVPFDFFGNGTGESVAETLNACSWLSQNLPRYDKWETTKLLSGLLTCPECQANTIRIETLIHLSVAVARGTHVARRDDLVVWFNRHFLVPSIARMEDPLEDVLLSNVIDGSGNHRIFEGIWESNAYWLQCILDVLARMPECPELAGVIRAASALMDVSEAVANRLGLERNLAGDGEPKGRVHLPHHEDLLAAGEAVVFSGQDLADLGISLDSLVPFILPDGSGDEILASQLERSPLERRPLLSRGGSVMLALPTAVGCAIKRHTLEVVEALGQMKRFESLLVSRQSTDITNDALRRLRVRSWDMKELPTIELSPPANLAVIPFRFDRDRFGLISTIALPLVADPNRETP